MSTLSCPACGAPSPAGKRFCAECGAALPLLCPACASPISPGQKFCSECGAALTAVAASTPAIVSASALPVAGASPPPVPQPPEEERRLVTALFCDLVGFTPLAERLDPEEVRDIQAEYFAAMAEQIERYGGIVEKYAGDAVLALFGARSVHEDDAERAVLCALAMQRAIEPVATRVRARWHVDPAIRVGVNTGEVVSGIWDVSGRQDVAVTGDAVNLAARMEAAAEPGEVLVGEETMRLTRRRISYGEVRELALKGKAGTVPGYRAEGVREQMGERWDEYERPTPLIGREREQLQLFDAWQRAIGGGGAIITVVGEPGVGKSRLLAELVARLDGTSTATRVIRARCLSYGQEISLWLVADLLRGLFGIREQDGTEEVRARLLPGLRSLLTAADAVSQEEAIDVLGEMLGLPAGGSLVAQAGPEIRRYALVRSLRLLFAGLSSRSPCLLMLEDLHWVDRASQDVLKEILSDLPGLRVLVLVTQRPGWTAPWNEWSWPERIALRPLKEADAAVLAGAVLGGMTLSRELERYAAERAGGNPFFVEQLLRALQETGGIRDQGGEAVLVPGSAERLPSTLTEVLLARLDRLESQARQVVQVGSVIGRSFAVRLLARVMEREQAALELPLVALQEAEIAFPGRGEDPEYVFKHVMMREVAYNTLVSRRRKELHRQTARAIAVLYPGEEYAEMIAYHYARTEAPEAAEWLERAGDRAAASYANDAAIAHYEEARRRREAAGEEGSKLARLQEKLGSVFSNAGRYDEAIGVLEAAIEGYREGRDLEAAGRATALLGTTYYARGTAEDVIARVQVMIELLRRSGPSPSLARLYIVQSGLCMATGRYRDELEAAERGSEIARAIGDEGLLGEAEARRGTALTAVAGQREEALAVLQQALPLIERAGDPTAMQITLNNLAYVWWRLGRMDETAASFERLLVIAEQTGNPAWLCLGLANHGETLAIVGDWEGARRVLDRGLVLARQLGDVPDAGGVLCYVGLLELWQGEWEEAREHLDDALRIAAAARELQEQAQAYLAELDVLEGKPQTAIDRLANLVDRDGPSLGVLIPPLIRAHLALEDEGHLQRAVEAASWAVSATREEPYFRAQALWVQGMVLRRQGRRAEAEAALTEALGLARPMPFPYGEARILYELGLVARAAGDEEGARQRLSEAVAIFQRLGARRDVERTEADLAPR